MSRNFRGIPRAIVKEQAGLVYRKGPSRLQRGATPLTTDQEAAAPPVRAHAATFSDPDAYTLATLNTAGAVASRFVGTSGKTFHAKLARLDLDRLGIGIGKPSVPVAFTAGT